VNRALAGALGLAGLLVVLVLAALAIGPYPVAPGEALAVLMRGPEAGGTAATVVFAVRLPRVLAALLVGGALGAAGACYQALFRNPLVSPDILGVSAGAGLGAAAGIFFALPVFAIQLAAFGGGLVAVALVTLVSLAVRGRDNVLVLVLAGVVVGSLAGALTSLLKVLADPYDQLPAITFWLLGSLSAVRGGDVLACLPAVLLGVLPLASGCRRRDQPWPCE
jgi:iron complex transport system permease protein